MWLRILAHNPVPGQREVIREALDAADFNDVLLGVAAAGVNYDPSFREPLLALLAEPELGLVHRARKSLAASGDPAVIAALLEQMDGDESSISEALDILSELRAQDVLDAASVAALEDACEAAAGVFSSPAVREAARERVALLSASHAAHHPSDGMRELVSAALTESVRCVLRNAEITVQRRDLFDERVDKSTAIVEYVKAIDLFLQDRLGNAVFAGGPASTSLLAQLRDRALALALDDDTVPGKQVIEALACGAHFTVESFPAYKLASICRAVVKGKILATPYKYMDGLRAWAALLVAFGRPYCHRGTHYPVLLPLARVDSEVVLALAAQLNDLQETRNRAAHRGTVLPWPEVDDVRRATLALLTALDEMLS
jgi:hypothetical protein